VHPYDIALIDNISQNVPAVGLCEVKVKGFDANTMFIVLVIDSHDIKTQCIDGCR
jgi:hypothetical protein